MRFAVPQPGWRAPPRHNTPCRASSSRAAASRSATAKTTWSSSSTPSSSRLRVAVRVRPEHEEDVRRDQQERTQEEGRDHRPVRVERNRETEGGGPEQEGRAEDERPAVDLVLAPRPGWKRGGRGAGEGDGFGAGTFENAHGR